MDRVKLQPKREQAGEGQGLPNLLHAVLGEIRTKQECQKIILEATKKYQIKQYNILSLSTEKVLQIYQNLKNKFYAEQINLEFQDQWFDNELRLFIWLFITYAHLHRKSVEDFTKKQWAQFCYVFQGKTPFLFEYQAKIIKKLTKKSKKWSGEEDQCLHSIIRHFTTLLAPIGTYKWSQVAKRLFIESNRKYFRTPKQCRERWMNHLDPLKLKSKWTINEDFSLIDLVLKEGKKWAMIAKTMGNIRTEHMVKNRYNSLLRAEMKKYDEMADENRAMQKLQNRLKYSLENKSAEKESASSRGKQAIKMEQQIQEEMEQQVQHMLAKGLNNSPPTENHQHFMEALDDMLESLKKEEPRLTCINLMEYQESNIEDHCEDSNLEFQFKPSYPDYF